MPDNSIAQDSIETPLRLDEFSTRRRPPSTLSSNSDLGVGGAQKKKQRKKSCMSGNGSDKSNPNGHVSDSSATNNSQVWSTSKQSKKGDGRNSKEKDYLDIMFEAISERPILENLSPEARIREKLKFFNLEKEDLEKTKKRISKRISNMGLRFMTDKGNNAEVKGGVAIENPLNPFEEMMAIE